MGSDVSIEQLSSPDAAEHLRRLRVAGPVSWVPAIAGWLVTGRDAAVAVLRDANTFTVDDERFSTAVVVGTSMLSTDGEEQARHRAPFGPPFAAAAVSSWQHIGVIAARVVGSLSGRASVDLRTEVAAPIAVAVIVDALGLGEVDHGEVLRWYRSIVTGVERVSAGLSVEEATTTGLASLHAAIARAGERPGSILNTAARSLTDDEVFANAAVVMFGAIETSEAMTANALWHLLTVPGLLESTRSDRSRVADLIEESLRLEPAAAVVDRYATRDVVLAGASIGSGDFVRVSLTGANRDPAVFGDPDRFDVERSNSRLHLAFVQGPHVCLGLHMARAQTTAAITAVLDVFAQLALDPAGSAPPTGLLFRKPDRLTALLR